MSERKQIGWVRWSRTIEGRSPVYEGDWDNFDPDEEDPNDEEMESLVEDRGDLCNPTIIDFDVRWVRS